MADAPQVAHTSPYPESYQKYDHAPEHYVASQHSPASAHNLYHPTPYVEKPRQDTILGIRRRNFWILAILAIVISAVVIGASVGGSLAVRKAGYVVFLLRLERRLVLFCLHRSRDKSELQTQPTPSFSASPTSSVPSQSVPATPSSTPTDGVYLPLPFAQVNTINVTCPSATYMAGQDVPELNNKYQFKCQNNKNLGGMVDLMSFTAYSFQQCVDACSQWNAMGRKPTCMGAVVGANFKYRRTSGNGANCWLKNATANLEDSSDTTLASYILPGT